MNNVKSFVKIRSKNISLLIILIFLLMGFVRNPSDQNIKRPAKISSASATLTRAPSSTSKLYLVSKVVDGDTIQLSSGEKVRYIGINTPERGYCFAKEATEANRRLVLNKMVRLEKDISETDKYGRLLRYVYVDNVFVNDRLVREGYARASTYPPDVIFQAQFSKAEQEARTKKVGLWADNTCNIK